MSYIDLIWSYVGNNTKEIIALAALFLAVWQGYLGRQHNKISTRPHLIFNQSISINSPQISIHLQNVGLGPAIIDSYSVFFDGQKYCTEQSSPMNEIGGSLNIKGVHGGGKSFEHFDAIPKDKEEHIFFLNSTDEKRDLNFDIMTARKEIKRIKIEIIYKSVYGEKFEVIFNDS